MGASVLLLLLTCDYYYLGALLHVSRRIGFDKNLTKVVVSGRCGSSELSIACGCPVVCLFFSPPCCQDRRSQYKPITQLPASPMNLVCQVWGQARRPTHTHRAVNQNGGGLCHAAGRVSRGAAASRERAGRAQQYDGDHLCSAHCPGILSAPRHLPNMGVPVSQSAHHMDYKHAE